MKLENKFVYFVGKLYDPNLEKAPELDGKYDLVVYRDASFEDQRVISSLEGIFVSEEVLDSFILEKPVRRDQMQEFEKKYNGKFYLEE